jgi:hypothetical protein
MKLRFWWSLELLNETVLNPVKIQRNIVIITGIDIIVIIIIIVIINGGRGGAVVEALRYKSEGRGIDSGWCHWNFSLTLSFRPHYGPGVDSASYRKEYQGYLLGVKAAGA